MTVSRFYQSPISLPHFLNQPWHRLWGQYWFRWGRLGAPCWCCRMRLSVLLSVLGYLPSWYLGNLSWDFATCCQASSPTYQPVPVTVLLTLSCCLMLCSPVTSGPQLGWIPSGPQLGWIPSIGECQAIHFSRRVSFSRTAHFVSMWTPVLKYLWAFQKGQSWFVTWTFKRS